MRCVCFIIKCVRHCGICNLFVQCSCNIELCDLLDVFCFIIIYVYNTVVSKLSSSPVIPIEVCDIFDVNFVRLLSVFI